MYMAELQTWSGVDKTFQGRRMEGTWHEVHLRVHPPISQLTPLTRLFLSPPITNDKKEGTSAFCSAWRQILPDVTAKVKLETWSSYLQGSKEF